MDYAARPMRSTRRLQNLTGQRPGWYKITNSASGPTMVSIYDEIGFFGVAAGDFMADLTGVNGDIELHINSPGGDVHDGIAIYNQLKQRKGNVHVVVDGLAASAASFIAMAASPGQLEMAPHSQMMIHNGFSMAIGDAADLRKTADLLDKVTAEIASIYAERTGKPADHWLALMAAETWFSDQEAVDAGLADNIQGQTAKNAWDLSVYNRTVNEVVEEDPAAKECPTCEGSGKIMDGHRECPDCKGTGKVDPKDPDGDGDDDTSKSGDTDKDYAGATPPRKVPGNRWLNADKYKQADRDRMAQSGEAMPDGSYPIADEEDLDNAIHAVGRGNADHDDIRKHIIKRAKALGLESKIPADWNDDGSMKDLTDVGALSALLVTHMAQERSRS